MSLDLVRSALRSLPPTNDPHTFHALVRQRLKAAGLRVQSEVLSHYAVIRQQGKRKGQVAHRRGRIDIVAGLGNWQVAIECDRVTPRAKSLAKLRSFKGARVLLLRDGLSGKPPEGIDLQLGFQETEYEPGAVCRMVGCGLEAGPEGVCCHCLEDLCGMEPSPTTPRRDDAAEQCDDAAVGGRLR